MKIIVRLFAFMGLLSLLLVNPIGTSSAAEEEIKASEVQVKTPVYQPSNDYDFPLGTYTYEVSWQGIPAAEATITIEKEPGLYLAEATARTYSGIDIFYKLRYRAEGLVSEKDFTPLRVTFEKKENRKDRFTAISYSDNGEILTVRENFDKDPNSESPDIEQFNPNNFTLEPFSAALLARSLDWAPGVSREFDTFNGKARYLITLDCVEKKVIEFNNQEREVFIVEPRVKNLTKPDANKKLRRAQIFVSTDKKREVLKIVSEVFIGSVTTRLESFHPSHVSPVQVANTERSEKLIF